MISKYRILMEVIRSGSFSQAAKNIGYSQSAVSQTIASLEKEYGTRLIVRNRDQLTLSKDGEVYQPYFEALVQDEEALEEMKKRMNGFEKQTIRIGTFTSVSRNLLPVLMQQFREEYPNVQFILKQGEYDDIHQWILNNEVDFGFLNPENFSDLHAEVIYRDTMVAVLPKGHPLENKKNIRLKDLEKEDFLLLDEGKKSVPLQAFQKASLHPHIAYKIYDDYSILAMVKQGMGVSILYSLVVAGFSDGLCIKSIQEPIERKIAIAYHTPVNMSRAVETFVKYVKKETPQILKDIKQGIL